MKVKANQPVFSAFLLLLIFLSGLLFIRPAEADFVRVRGTVVNVRQGPGTTYPVFFQAEQGDEFPLKKTEGLWCLVQLKDGEEAWVFAKLVDVMPGEISGGATPAPETAPEEKDRSLLQRAAKPAFYLAMFILFLFLLRKRKKILRKASSKLMEASGYQREKPFRYDDRQPRDDSWEL